MISKWCILILLSIGACTIPGIPVPDRYKKKPVPEVSPSPTPKPVIITPEPKPTKPPQVAVLLAPASIAAGVPFNVSLCGLPYEYGVDLFADYKFLLGTFGFDRASGCSMVFGVVLNRKGLRILTTKNSEPAKLVSAAVTVE